MHPTKLARFFVPDPLVLQQIVAFLLLQHVQLFLQALLLVLEHPLLKLIDLLLLVLVDIVVLRFLQIELRDLVHQTQTGKLLLEGVCGNHGHFVSIH